MGSATGVLTEIEMVPAAKLRKGDSPRAEPASQETREVPRITLMLRASKLVFGETEVLCVLRDVSPKGIRVRLFHPLPAAQAAELELGSGARYNIEKIWDDGEEAGFRFVEGPVSLDELVEETGPFPRRHLRLKLDVAGVVKTLTGTRTCVVRDISQFGALIICDPSLPLGARVTVSGPGLSELEGIVRWRRRDAHGLVFTRGFRLDELARLADSLQRAPSEPRQSQSAARGR